MLTTGLSAAEIADRKAIEAIWVKYWEVTEPILKTPRNDRAKVLATVSVDPQLTKFLAAAIKFEKNGWDNYGMPGHRIYWGPPVDGGERAIMGDCMDFSQSGRYDVKSGKALTVGVGRSNVRGLFERQNNGSWRVYGLQALVDTPC